MALPDLSTLSISIPAQAPLCITFPGGGQMCAQLPSVTPPDPMSLALSLIGNANAALMPIQPIFNILAVVTDLVNCVKAVEKCLGPPPNPTKLIQCFPQLAEDLAKLLEMIPQLSVPVMIAGLLQSILAFLEGLRAQLLVIAAKYLKIEQAFARAASSGSAALATAAGIATANLTAFLASLSATSKPIVCLLNLINDLLGLIGLPALNVLPPAGSDPAQVEALLAPLDDVILVLSNLLALLPLGSSC